MQADAEQQTPSRFGIDSGTRDDHCRAVRLCPLVSDSRFNGPGTHEIQRKHSGRPWPQSYRHRPLRHRASPWPRRLYALLCRQRLLRPLSRSPRTAIGPNVDVPRRQTLATRNCRDRDELKPTSTENSLRPDGCQNERSVASRFARRLCPFVP